MGASMWNFDYSDIDAVAGKEALEGKSASGKPGKSQDIPTVSKQNETTQDSNEEVKGTSKDRRSIKGKERSLLSLGNKQSTSILGNK